MIRRLIICAAGCALVGTAQASDAAIAGDGLSLLWALPFLGMLLSIALGPVAAPHYWHRWYPHISVLWAGAFALPFALLHGWREAIGSVWHTAVLEYLPFIIMLFALYVVAGGIYIRGRFAGSPNVNTGMLAFGTILASFIGTTGAAMLLIRPMIRANQNRRFKVHVFVFFIFLVGNIGGSLTPLGDPPLFLGFLKGVTFAWTMEHMMMPLLLTGGILLAVFYALDRFLWTREGRPLAGDAVSEGSDSFSVQGGVNLVFLAVIVMAVLASGMFAGMAEIDLFGVHVPVESLARNAVLLAVAYASMRLTAAHTRHANGFTWEPIREVAFLFIGIFVTIIPLIAILAAGEHGPAGPAIALVSDAGGQPINAVYFWVTGLLSSVLDNAPTYLVFFNVAHGDARELMGPLSDTLLAISAGAVFFGALTYIGNAPNFMIKAICEEREIKMPSFFAYIGWSAAFLLPVFALNTLVFFR
jgi:Na+/H+ antiporter NhaD/arsenite permease-like protein